MKEIKAIVQPIAATARTGRPGDGKILVSDVERASRIRSGEEDEDGL